MFRILFKHKIFLAISLVTALLVTSCNLPKASSGPTPIPQLVFPTFPPTITPNILTATAEAPETATEAAPTSEAVQPTAAAPNTAPGTTTQPQPGPVSTSIPSSSGASRISFVRGATASVTQGTLQPGTPKKFVVRAMGGQPLIVSVESASQEATLSVAGQNDGKIYLDVAQNAKSWQTLLTVSQDYLLTVYPGASAENFTLNVIIPARIAFQTGASSTSVQGSTPGGLIVSYVLRGLANQQMNINLNSPDGNAVLGIYGYQDGQPYLRSASEQTTFSLKLPTTQDYIIQVAPRAGQVASYTMNVTVK